MGTNYYCMERKISMHNRILHIGKSSLGWKFLFQGYENAEGIFDDEIYISSVEDWKDYLNNPKVIILDEYDSEISYKDFFKMVEEKQKENNPEDFRYNANIGGYRFSFRDFG